jgi:PadR family transcriptional regulator, regulatory protein PadR
MRHHPRARRRTGGNRWNVHARVERFMEPALLLLLQEQPAHGYELIERLSELAGGRRIEMGNLYRLLRGLEEEGLVVSEWDASAPGPAKRRYETTREGRALLEQWVEALRETRGRIDAFVERYENGRR